MQVTETVSDGLKREFQVSVPAADLEAKLVDRIRELNAKIVEEHGLKLAMEPKVTIPNEATEVERVIGGQSDLAYTLSVEVLPKIELGNFGGISLERLVAEVGDPEVNDAIEKVAEQNRPYAAKGEGGKVEKGDRVVVDFTGKIDGQPFEG